MFVGYTDHRTPVAKHCMFICRLHSLKVIANKSNDVAEPETIVITELGGSNHPLGDFVACATILFYEEIIMLGSSLEAQEGEASQPELALRLEVFLEKGLDAIGDAWLDKLEAEGLGEGFYSKPK